MVLTVLLVRGVTLDGAGEGIKFYLQPDFNKLADAQVNICVIHILLAVKQHSNTMRD